MRNLRFAVYFISILAVQMHSDHEGLDFGYDHHNGPSKWTGTCSIGKEQSPVDISPSAIETSQLPRLNFHNYDRYGYIALKNSGKSFLGSGFPDWGNQQPYISGGNLDGKYFLDHFHIHWSQTNFTGSEHTVASLHYPAEMHFVHVKGAKSLASLHSKQLPRDGIAVLGVFIVIGSDRQNFKFLHPILPRLIHAGSNSSTDKFKPGTFLPKNLDTFYQYSGSLTTPPCSEAVIWNILADPVTITVEQINAIRNLRSYANQTYENYRPVTLLGGRKIKLRPFKLVQTQENSAVNTFSNLVWLLVIISIYNLLY